MDELVSIAFFVTPIEAHILQTQLEAADIPCLTLNQNLIHTNALWTNLLGGVQIQVRRADAERASEILQQIKTA